MILLSTLMGCGGGCATNENLTADGTCVPQGDPVGWDETTLPGHRLRACNAEPGDGSIDLIAGCAQGVCRDDTYATFAATLGQPDEFDGSGSNLRVVWDAIELWAWFDDPDGNNRPDDTALPDLISLHDRSSGSSAEGLRVGVSLACFVQQLGQPSDVDTEDDRITTLWFDDHDLWVSDFTGQQSFLDPDGYADTIAINDR